MAGLGPFGPDRRVAVAVSGGADSTALAILAAEWGRARGFVVDHGLRDGSAAEAAGVASRLTQFGVPCRVLRLSLSRGPGLATQARAARYEALTAACREEGFVDLLVGHHARDQAETILLRQRRGSGPTGLGGMAAIRIAGGIRILRPLLPMPPGRLRATLVAAGHPWVEDPSNADPASARAALRAELNDPAGDGPTTTALVTCAAKRGQDRARTEAATAVWLAAYVSLWPAGVALVGPGALDGAGLAAAVWTVSGRPYPPSAAAVARRIAIGSAGSLHSTLLAQASGRWSLTREPAGVAAPVPAQPGALWDGRFSLAPWAAPPPGATVGALEGDASRFRRRTHLRAAALASLPALRCGNNLFAVPHVAYPNSVACSHVPIAFSPGRSLAGRAFVIG